MAADIAYRVLSEPEQFEHVIDLEIRVWGIEPRDAVPSTMLRALQHGGGLINGAYLGNELVGMAVMYPIPLAGRLVQWSHMAGVHPEYQKYGIGRGLKLQQREWALANGYDEIRWTYDPLLRGNANFNLRKLGATFDTYLINFYGIMTDAINADGLPSDRVEAVWRLNDARVVALVNGEPLEQTVDYPALLQRDEHGQPQIVGVADGKAVGYRVQLPQQIKGLSHDTLVAWRLALRATLQTAFATGYAAVDFLADEAAYIVHKR